MKTQIQTNTLLRSTSIEKPEPIPSVIESLSTLTSAVGNLSGTVELLEGRLECVMSPPTPSDNGVEGPRPAPCKLVSDVYDITQAVGRLNDRVSVILQRLQV